MELQAALFSAWLFFGGMILYYFSFGRWYRARVQEHMRQEIAKLITKAIVEAMIERAKQRELEKQNPPEALPTSSTEAQKMS